MSSRTCEDRRQPTTLQPGIPDDVDLERLRTAIYGLHDEHQVSHLPRATQLPPVPGLPPVGPHRAFPTRVSIDLDKLMPTTTLRRRRRAFSGGTAFLVAGTIAAVWAGYFVTMDFAEAPNSASADQGHAEAQKELANLYYHGAGVPKDRRAAAAWFRKAADQGDVEAQNRLGLMYYEGDGVLQDYVLAHAWFNLAASAALAPL